MTQSSAQATVQWQATAHLPRSVVHHGDMAIHIVASTKRIDGVARCGGRSREDRCSNHLHQQECSPCVPRNNKSHLPRSHDDEGSGDGVVLQRTVGIRLSGAQSRLLHFSQTNRGSVRDHEP